MCTACIEGTCTTHGPNARERRVRIVPTVAVEAELARLDELIRLSKQLGFHDDVDHWTAERAKLSASPGGSPTAGRADSAPSLPATPPT